MDNRPVGFFDSGFGGLTALAAFRRILPEENILFFGDSGRAPYGPKSTDEIRICAGNILRFFRARGVKAVFAACGTCSALAPDLIDGCGVVSGNVLVPSAARLAELQDDHPLGVIATEASVRSGGFERALRKAGVRREIISVACPDFVTLIEAGVPYSDPRVRDAVERYLAPIREAGATALLLGCTHYGIIEPTIRDYLGKDVAVFSASECGAAALAETLKTNGLTGGCGEETFFTSGNAEDFRRTGSLILGREIGNVTSMPEWEV